MNLDEKTKGPYRVFKHTKTRSSSSNEFNTRRDIMERNGTLDYYVRTRVLSKPILENLKTYNHTSLHNRTHINVRKTKSYYRILCLYSDTPSYTYHIDHVKIKYKNPFYGTEFFYYLFVCDLLIVVNLLHNKLFNYFLYLFIFPRDSIISRKFIRNLTFTLVIVLIT